MDKTNVTRSEVPPSSTRTELRNYARSEFERHRELTDLVCFLFSGFCVLYC